MNKYLQQCALAMALLAGVSSTAAAGSVCKILPGHVTCGKGTVSQVSGNGIVTINGTIVTGLTQVNGLLFATNANFFSLDANGNINLIQCIINDASQFSGTLNASLTEFNETVNISTSTLRLINSKVKGNLHLLHSESKKQIVYLDNFSDISGDIIFDDGDGVVVIRGNSTVSGEVIGGRIAFQ